jgi:hypothetical protein
VYVGTNYSWDGDGRIPPRLHIIDAGDPAQPREVGSLDMPGVVGTPGWVWGPVDIAVAGNYAYLATALPGLRIVDISNPAAPVEVGFFDTDDWATSVAVDGDRAYVADRDSGLIAIDIANPMAPAKLDVYNTPSSAGAVAAANGTVYTNNGGGLAILRVLHLPYRAYLPLVDRKATS